MPMQLTITRNRKRSEDFNSEGHGVSITVEVDQGLLTKPAELQKKIDYLFVEAETSLDRQEGQTPGLVNQHSAREGNGQAYSDNPPARRGTMTEAQERAIRAIAKRLKVDPERICRDEMGLDFETLDVRRASQVIDHLKAIQGSSNGGGR